jgi:hypothetical protein
MIERLEDAAGLVDHPLVQSRMRGLPADRLAQMLGEERFIRLRDGEDIAIFEDRTLGHWYGIVFDIDQVTGFTWGVLEYLFSTVGAVELILDSVREDAGYQFGGYHAGIKLSQASNARWQWRLERRHWQKALEEHQNVEITTLSVPTGAGADGGQDQLVESADEIADADGGPGADAAAGRRQQRAACAEQR